MSWPQDQTEGRSKSRGQSPLFCGLISREQLCNRGEHQKEKIVSARINKLWSSRRVDVNAPGSLVLIRIKGGAHNKDCRKTAGMFEKEGGAQAPKAYYYWLSFPAFGLSCMHQMRAYFTQKQVLQEHIPHARATYYITLKHRLYIQKNFEI